MRRFIAVFTSQRTVTVSRQVGYIQSTPSPSYSFRSLSKHNFSTFLPRSTMEPLSFRCSYQTSIHICLLSHPHHKHRPSHPCTFDRPDVGRGERITKCLIVQLLTHLLLAAYFLDPNIIVSTVFSITLTHCSSLSMKERAWRPCNTYFRQDYNFVGKENFAL
jgi:hypothetical protein